MIVVVLNFASGRRAIELEKAARVLLGSVRKEDSALAAGRIELGPCEAIVASVE